MIILVFWFIIPKLWILWDDHPNHWHWLCFSKSWGHAPAQDLENKTKPVPMVGMIIPKDPEIWDDKPKLELEEP